MGEPVRGDDDRCSAQADELDEQQTERAATVDADPGADRDRGKIEGMERDAERLEEGGLLVADRVRHL